ncbi:MAG: hypothetical protein OXC31_02305 [Spirochaetaceae bacterium]|nr:hypothetical protein [Spirochaetaceae bacterium]
MTLNQSQDRVAWMTPPEITVAREELKSLIDDLSDYELDAVRQYIQSLHPSDDPVASALADVPADDEPVTDDDLSAIEESDADIDAGRVVSIEQLKREYGA